MSTDEDQLFRKLAAGIKLQLERAGASTADEWLGFSPATSLFEPIDVQREAIGLRNLLGAAEALGRDVEHDGSSD